MKKNKIWKVEAELDEQTWTYTVKIYRIGRGSRTYNKARSRWALVLRDSCGRIGRRPFGLAFGKWVWTR